MSKDVYLRKAPRDSEGRFHNPWPGAEVRSTADLLKWWLSRNPFAEEKKKAHAFRVIRPDFKALESTGRDYIVWLGHSTVLIKAGGKRFLTDPIFGDVNFLVRRRTPFPVEPSDLPRIDFVLISHGHYDHLNTDSIKTLRDRFDPVFISGPGYDEYFESLGITRRVPLNWTEHHEADGLRITSLPVQHWSKRSLTDLNRMLWASFLIEAGGKRYYWVGDTAYFGGFKEIGERFGPVDVFMGPVGSYEPRWFMKENHMNPEEAVQAARDVRARVFIPTHWGTFDLTDEPLWLPIERLKTYNGDTPPEVRILNHGGSWREQ